MPKFIVSVTRNVAEHAEAAIEAKTANEARRIFRRRVDVDELDWRDGDYTSEAEIVEVLPAQACPAELRKMPLTELTESV